MADVTVISPNVVDLTGSLQPRDRASAPPQPPPRDKPPLKARDPSGEKSRGLAANNNNRFSAAQRQDIEDQPRSKSRPTPRPERRPSQPSTNFLTQLLAQRSATGSVAAKRFDKAIAAYENAAARKPSTSPTGVAFLTRTVDQKV